MSTNATTPAVRVRTGDVVRFRDGSAHVVTRTAGLIERTFGFADHADVTVAHDYPMQLVEAPRSAEPLVRDRFGDLPQQAPLTRTVADLEGDTPCDCGGTGVWTWATAGGRTRSGVHFACEGKGHQTAEDRKRNNAYWNANGGRTRA